MTIQTTTQNILANASAAAEENANFEGFPPLKECNYTAEFRPIQYGSTKNIVIDEEGKVKVTWSDFKPIEASGGQAIVRTDNNKVLGIMKKRYAIANNPDIIVPVQECLEDCLPKGAMNGIQLKEAVSDGGAVARFGYHFEGLGREIRQLTKVPTQLNFMVQVVNSFNGQTAIRLQAGGLDLACLNGMTSLLELKAGTWGHTAGFKPEYIKPWLIDQIAFYEKKVEVWQMWANREITPEQAEKVLTENFPASKSEIARAEKKGKVAGEIQSKMARSMMEQFETEVAARGQTVWALYSALTFYSSHNSELFKVKNSPEYAQDVTTARDNVERTLIERERKVSEIERSESFQELAAV